MSDDEYVPVPLTHADTLPTEDPAEEEAVEDALGAWQDAQPGRWFTEHHEDGFRAGYAAARERGGATVTDIVMYDEPVDAEYVDRIVDGENVVLMRELIYVLWDACRGPDGYDEILAALRTWPVSVSGATGRRVELIVERLRKERAPRGVTPVDKEETGTEFECFVAGVLSTFPPFTGQHPSTLLPMARDVVAAMAGWHPADGAPKEDRQ